MWITELADVLCILHPLISSIFESFKRNMQNPPPSVSRCWCDPLAATSQQSQASRQREIKKDLSMSPPKWNPCLWQTASEPVVWGWTPRQEIETCHKSLWHSFVQLTLRTTAVAVVDLAPVLSPSNKCLSLLMSHTRIPLCLRFASWCKVIWLSTKT